MKKLTGNQSKLDLNKNGKLDSNDFKMLRGEMAKGGGTSRSQKQYNKEVDRYKFFVIDVSNKKAVSGWEFKEDAQEALSDYDGDKNFKVVAEVTLSKMGIENPKGRFKQYSNGGGTGVSSETGYAEGTNADLIMNQDYLAYKNGGGVGNVDTELIDASAKTIYDKNGMMGLRNTFLVLANTDEKSGDKSTADYRRKVVSNYQAKQPKFMKDGGSLADTPESFPSTDAMSYKNGGGIGEEIDFLRQYDHAKFVNGKWENTGKYKGAVNASANKYITNKRADEIISQANEMGITEDNIKTFAKGGSTSGWCYSIGGL